MDREKLIYRKNLRGLKKGFKIKKAIIYDTPKEDWADMGILFTKKLLFNHKKLLKLSGERKPLILPICLASKDLNLADKSMHGVGWGRAYDESPTRDKTNPQSSNPVYSSCMTNQMGNKDWRFQACNMDQIMKNNWSCEKKNYPPGQHGNNRRRGKKSEYENIYAFCVVDCLNTVYNKKSWQATYLGLVNLGFLYLIFPLSCSP